ncbi:MAG TPA: hypothetical protein VMF61_16865, partial [Candidatus Acidoferrales bacterium]|nr:hypothetical protein [Candidatus Acidoferrales bacterium]
MSELAVTLDDLRERFRTALEAASDERALDEARVAYLGRSGEVTQLRRAIGALPPGERPTAGKVINDAVERMEAELLGARERLERRELETELAQRIDVTFPSIAPQT